MHLMFPSNYAESITLTVLILIGLLIIRYLLLRHKDLLFKFMDIDMSSKKGTVIIQIETTTKISKSSSLMIVNVEDRKSVV